MAFLSVLQSVINSFGAVIVVPIIIFIIALALKVKPKQAFMSALLAGVSLEGIQLLIGSYTPVVAPLMQNMGNLMQGITGNDLQVFDVGWQAASLVAYSTTAGMIYLALGILIQMFFFGIKWTNVFQPSDLWNNYSYPLWGSMVAIATGSLPLGILVMVILNLYSLLWADMYAKRWSTYYHYPNCMIPAMHNLEPGIFAIVLDPLWNLLHLNKVKLNPTSVQKKIGFLGEPMTIGLFVGLLIGILGVAGDKEGANLASFQGWGKIAACAIATAAVMGIFPKVTGIFAQAFGPITDAARKRMGTGKVREWYVAVNDAVAYGEEATLTTGLILMPILIVVAFFLPGNKVLPVVDLVAIPYSLECIVSLHNGNMAKALLTSLVYYVVALYIGTFYAEFFTHAAVGAGYSLAGGMALISSLAVLCRPVAGVITLAFLSGNPVIMTLTVVVYAVWYAFWRKNDTRIISYFEKMAAKNEGTQPVAEIAV